MSSRKRAKTSEAPSVRSPSPPEPCRPTRTQKSRLGHSCPPSAAGTRWDCCSALRRSCCKSHGLCVRLSLAILRTLAILDPLDVLAPIIHLFPALPLRVSSCVRMDMISLSFIACCSCCSCCCCSCSCCSCSCSCCSCSCSCSCCSCCSCAAPALSTCANIQSVLNHCCSSRPLPFMPPGIQCLRRALFRRFRCSARTAPAALCRHVARHAHLVLAVAQVGVLGLACVVETV